MELKLDYNELIIFNGLRYGELLNYANFTTED